MADINISKFIDQNVYSIGSTLAYHLPDISSAIVKTYSDGEFIGIVDSFNKDKYGNYFLAFNPASPYYVLIDLYSLSIPALGNGALGNNYSNINYDIPPPTEVNATPPIGQGISDAITSISTGITNTLTAIGKYLPYIVVGGVALYFFSPQIKELLSGKKKK